MSNTQLIQSGFDRMVRDLPRDRLPKNTCWDIVDAIPNELGGPCSKRGGWTRASEALTNVLTGADVVQGVIPAPFSAGEQVVAWTTNLGTGSRVAQIVSSSSTTDRGAPAFTTLGQQPVFYRNFVYFVDAAGATAPSRYSGSANTTALTGSPPTGSRCTVYKDRLVLARSSSQLQRLWFSAAGTPTTWDTTFGFIDTSGEVTAIYALRNAILIWHPNSLERITGSTPPPGTDMSLQPVFDSGCPYPFSIAGTDEFVCFANANGIHMTDGSTVVDITEQGGMSSYWRGLFGGGRQIASGYFRGYLVVSVIDASGFGEVATLLVHLKTRRFTRLSNVRAWCFAPSFSSTGELYWGSAEEPRVEALSPIFSPASANKNDGDGTAVTPVIETQFFSVGAAEGRLWDVFLAYDLRDAATDNPTITMSYVTDPTDTAYTAVTGFDGNAYPYPETSTRMKRNRRQIRKTGFGIAVKLQQANASSVTHFNRLEMRSGARDASGVSQ
jgi:hypothetical protein